eukprot:scaffold8529_cov137-Cylindrotheca_fusiformis.AAC.3
MASQKQQRGETISSSQSSNTPSTIADEIRTRLHGLSTEPYWSTVELAHTVDPHWLLRHIRLDLTCLIVSEGSLLEIEDPVLQTLQENKTLNRCLQSLSSLGPTLSSREALNTIDKFRNATQLLKSRIDELQTRGLQNIARQQDNLIQLHNSMSYLEFLVKKLDENRTCWNDAESKSIVWELERIVNNCKKIKQEVRLLEGLKGTIAVDFALDETKAIMETLPDDHESIPSVMSVMEAIESIERIGTLLDQFSQCGAKAFTFQRIKDMNVDTTKVSRVEDALRVTGIASSLARMSAKAVLEQNGLRVVVRVLQGYLRSEEDMHFLECCITIIYSVVREGEGGAIAFTSIVGALEAVTAAGAKDCISHMQDPHQPFQEAHKVARKVVRLLLMIAEHERGKEALKTDDCIEFLESVVNRRIVDEDLEHSIRSCLEVLALPPNMNLA